VTHLSPVSARVVAAADRLRFVGVPRGGPVNVNLAAATAAGVSVAHLPGRNAQAVAEYTIAAMITGPRGLAHSATQMRAGCWTGDLYRYDRTGFELAGADVGLIGLGQIGHRVARLLRAFGARVQAYDPYVDPDVAAETGAVLVDDLITAISDKHIVSMHARITDETRGMLGAEQFASMRTGTFLVNSARGDLIDEPALIAALQSGRLSGAAVDVFTPEPPTADNPLRTMPNVFVTSHLAGSSRQVAERAARRIAAEAGRFVRGEPLLNPANPGVRVDYGGPRGR
jgi:D-3-phosphoglycerate dehydrogenase